MHPGPVTDATAGSPDDALFLLNDVFHIDRYANLPGFAEASSDVLSAILDEVGASPRATWCLAEGQDAALMTRSVPVKDVLAEAMLDNAALKDLLGKNG